MTDNTSPDHRSRVGADRRTKTRNRLIEAAIAVFAEKGVDAPVIDDVIRAAGVSRGTFYNYFQSNHDLLVAVNDQLRDELVLTFSDAVADIRDPSERIALTLGMLIRFGRETPLLASFVAKLGPDAAGPERLIGGYMSGLIQDCIDQGRIRDCPIVMGLDLVAGAILFAFVRISRGGGADIDVPALVRMVLRGIGLDPQEAAELAARPSPDVTVRAACSLVCSASRDRPAGRGD